MSNSKVKSSYSAVILVGGLGTRLRPLTLTRAKPLVELANKPIVLHQIEALAKAGVSQVILAVLYKAEEFKQKLLQLTAELDVSLIFSEENEPLGTAGPLALAQEILEASNKPFFVLNSDIICDFPFKELADYHTSHGREGTVVVTRVDEPSKYGVIACKDDGQITSFIEKPREFVSNKINAGIYMLNATILKRLELRAMSIEKEIFPKMVEEEQLYAMELEGFWMDIGQPKDYLTGVFLYLDSLRRNNSDSLEKGENIEGNVLIDASACIGKNCRIGPNVTIGPGVTIEEGSRIKNTVILEDAFVGSHTRLDNCIVGWRSQIGSWVRMENATIGENVKVKDELYINGGQVIPHKCITESVFVPAVKM